MKIKVISVIRENLLSCVHSLSGFLLTVLDYFEYVSFYSYALFYKNKRYKNNEAESGKK